MEQCRFNRLSPTLEAVACVTNSDTTENATACLDQISANLPVASGFVCYGDNVTIIAPVAAETPIRVSFSPTSSAGCPLCPAYVVFTSL